MRTIKVLGRGEGGEDKETEPVDRMDGIKEAIKGVYDRKEEGGVVGLISKGKTDGDQKKTEVIR